MTKKQKNVVAYCLIFVMCVCSLSGTAVISQAASKKAVSVALNTKSKSLTVGQKYQLKVKKVRPLKASKSVIWKSSNSKVVKVNGKGKITAKKVGKVTITAVSKANKKVKATCKVTVYSKATKVALSDSIKKVKAGESFQLKAIVYPKKAKQEVTYFSSNVQVASVTKRGKVIGKNEGKAIITVVSKTNKSKKAKCVVYVSAESTGTVVPDVTQIPTVSNMPTGSGEPTISNMPTGSGEPTVSNMPTGSGEPTVSNTPTGSGEPTVSNMPTGSGEPIVSNMPTGSGEPTVSNMPTGSGKPTVSNTPTGSGEPTVSNTPTGSGEPIVSNMPTGSGEPTVSNMPTGSGIPTNSSTPTGSGEPIVSSTPTGGGTPIGSSTPASSTPTGTPIPLGNGESYAGVSGPRKDGDDNVIYDCVYFGNYPQSDATGETKEPIKWRVLSIDGTEAFLVADQNLDVYRYHESWTSVTWENSTIRSWLNGYDSKANVFGQDYSNDNFINRAFTDKEQKAIPTVTVVNEDKAKYGTQEHNDTKDKIYLLSIGEVSNESYGFLTNNDEGHSNLDNARKRTNTAYVEAGGTIGSSGMAPADSGSGWWLRSPGRDYYSNAAQVDYVGNIFLDGYDVVHELSAVCPVLHLDLSVEDVWTNAGTVTIEKAYEHPWLEP